MNLGGQLLDLGLERLDLGFQLSDPLVLAVDDIQELLVGRWGHPDPSCRRDQFHRPPDGDRTIIDRLAC